MRRTLFPRQPACRQRWCVTSLSLHIRLGLRLPQCTNEAKGNRRQLLALHAGHRSANRLSPIEIAASDRTSAGFRRMNEPPGRCTAVQGLGGDAGTFRGSLLPLEFVQLLCPLLYVELLQGGFTWRILLDPRRCSLPACCSLRASQQRRAPNRLNIPSRPSCPIPIALSKAG